MPLLLIFIIIPLMEVGAFIAVGERIGLGYTLLTCVLTALIGGWLVRQQGMDTVLKGRKSLDEGYLPVHEIFDGLCILVSGALLLTPGFVTDFIGFSLLIPPVRVHLREFLKDKVHILAAGSQAAPEQPARSDIVEGEFERVDDEDHTKG